MIQRIQTVWLSLCTILSLLLLKGPILVLTGKGQELLSLGFNGLSSATGNLTQFVGNSKLLSASIIIIPVFSMLGILLYKNRLLQKIAVLAVIIASFILSFMEGFYWNLAASKYDCMLSPGVKMFFPVVIIIFAILAYLGIRKDENIVKSYDRLR
jgi:hypothetical protein